MVMIAESHITLHIFPDSDEAFFDLFSCKFFDVEPVVRVLAEQFGGNVTEQVLVPRGQRYLQLRTERTNARYPRLLLELRPDDLQERRSRQDCNQPVKAG